MIGVVDALTLALSHGERGSSLPSPFRAVFSTPPIQGVAQGLIGL